MNDRQYRERLPSPPGTPGGEGADRPYSFRLGNRNILASLFAIFLLATPIHAQARLSDDAMKSLADKAFQDIKVATSMTELASNNPNVGGKRLIANPLDGYRVWCIALPPNPAYIPRHFLAVSRTGTVVPRVTPADILKMLQDEDTSKWTDEQFVKAAALAVHMQTFANQDGWTIVKSPKDFLAIEFNMHLADRGKRKAAADEIKAPEVVRKDGSTRITFYAWHLIGGELKRWDVVIGPKASVVSKSFGSFGGGGYE